MEMREMMNRVGSWARCERKDGRAVGYDLCGGCLEVSCWICSDAGKGAGDRQLQSYAAQLHKLAHTHE